MVNNFKQITGKYTFNFLNRFIYAEFKKQLAALGKYLSKEQSKEIIDKYFDKKCDLCDTELDNFSDAQRHYLKEHKIRDGYLKCCGIKHKTSRTVLDHAHWHHDPNTFM